MNFLNVYNVQVNVFFTCNYISKKLSFKKIICIYLIGIKKEIINISKFRILMK